MLTAALLLQSQAIIDATVAADTIRPLALGWKLDKPARLRGAPEAFLSSHAETLFFSLVGGMRAAFGDDECGGWLMQVMGEYVRQAYEKVKTGAVEMEQREWVPLSVSWSFASLTHADLGNQRQGFRRRLGLAMRR